MFIDEKLYWGADRLELVDRALGSVPPMSLQIMDPLPSKQKKVQFFFDLSSPWAFLGITQIHKISQYAEVEFVPILLGALFKAIGTPNVPLLAMSPAKQKYMSKDLGDYSNLHGETIKWPSAFSTSYSDTSSCRYCRAENSHSIGKGRLATKPKYWRHRCSQESVN
eukprot:TRINITY_DN744_c0_g1_i1.p1 TRINITY_DN744_c0_g1~~TRINITY_DN744_c0_g1_i1.p1  ORF type:complete len:166 (-),score=22.95 TRINITY_DN744_c0_g1_i1:246-743(-)